MSRAIFAIALLALPFRALGAHSYPVPAHVVDAADVQEQCSTMLIRMKPPCGLLSPARAALRGAAANLFLAAKPDEPPAVELSVASASVEAATAGGGYQVTFRVEVEVSLAGKGRTTVHSDVDMLVGELAPERIRAAAERATPELQRHLEEDLVQSQDLVDWLRSREIQPRRSLVWPVRQSTRFYAGAGVGGLQGGDGSPAPIFFGRLGVETRWLGLQVFAGKTSPTFTGAASPSVITSDATLDAVDLGVEGAVSIRVLPYLDLRAGPGLHYLFGDASLQGPTPASSSFGVVTPTIFASLLFAIKPFESGTRMTLSLEGRKYLNTTAELPKLSRAVPIADFSFAALFGCEVPLGAP